MIDNPRLDLNELDILEGKIKNNIADEKDYEMLEYFLNSIGMDNYILKLFKENNIVNYKHYINERNSLSPESKRKANGLLLGNLLGVISGLKEYLKK